MVKAVNMAPSFKTVSFLIGIVRAVISLQVSGIHIRELTTKKQETSNYRELQKFNEVLHRFALNHHSEFLVENLSSRDFIMCSTEGEFPKDEIQRSVWRKMGIRVDIKMTAYGFDSTVVDKVDPIIINGVGSGLNGRGFHVVILSSKDGTILKKELFDTYEDGSASDRMVQFIESSGDGSIVAISVQDEGTLNLKQTARRYIMSLGSQYIAGLNYRDTLVIVTATGVPKPPWFAEAFRNYDKVSSSLDVRIWL